jgi:hypothetical protein
MIIAQHGAALLLMLLDTLRSIALSSIKESGNSAATFIT